jgi:hypothetical protein
MTCCARTTPSLRSASLLPRGAFREVVPVVASLGCGGAGGGCGGAGISTGGGGSGSVNRAGCGARCSGSRIMTRRRPRLAATDPPRCIVGQSGRGLLSLQHRGTSDSTCSFYWVVGAPSEAARPKRLAAKELVGAPSEAVRPKRLAAKELAFLMLRNEMRGATKAIVGCRPRLLTNTIRLSSRAVRLSSRTVRLSPSRPRLSPSRSRLSPSTVRLSPNKSRLSTSTVRLSPNGSGYHRAR